MENIYRYGVARISAGKEHDSLCETPRETRGDPPPSAPGTGGRERMTTDLRAALVAALVKARLEWIVKAEGVECTYGDADPAAKAFRVCTGDIYQIIKEHGGYPDDR